MTIRILAIAIILALISAFSSAQTPDNRPILIKAGHLIDVRAGRVMTDQAIIIKGERIAEVGPARQVQSKAGGARVIDLSTATVLPGMIDCHTNILLQGDVTADDYDSSC